MLGIKYDGESFRSVLVFEFFVDLWTQRKYFAEADWALFTDLFFFFLLFRRFMWKWLLNSWWHFLPYLTRCEKCNISPFIIWLSIFIMTFNWMSILYFLGCMASQGQICEEVSPNFQTGEFLNFGITFPHTNTEVYFVADLDMWVFSVRMLRAES